MEQQAQVLQPWVVDPLVERTLGEAIQKYYTPSLVALDMEFNIRQQYEELEPIHATFQEFAVDIRCMTCQHFIDTDKHDTKDFTVGTCDREPFDIRTMRSGDATVQCGHDGGMITGENFGCIHWEESTHDANSL